MYQETKIRELISNLWTETNKQKSLDIAIELANELLVTFGAPSTSIKNIDEALENAYPYSHFKNQKMESWFEKHRFYGDARTAFKLFDSAKEVYESSFFWMNESSTKGRIAATTLLGSNWEDSDLTMKPEYKLGIDFYLNHDANALLLVVSKKGNVRVLEFSERLTHTQKQILDDLINVFNITGINLKDPYEPQRTIHEKIWSTLQLNSVNKAFYKGVSDLFEELSEYLKVRYASKDIKDLQLFSSRLLGRLLFVWFLRKKHIIDETHGYFDYETISSTDYYNQNLKLLFFDTLNNQITDRNHNDKNTPFLNGGLFETHENDYYNEKIEFPNNYFTRFYEHLNKYNFTVDESTPEYEQVAIDPEMLGRVFENLLASIVPETSSVANERKNKGAFYTPREIVSYMCKESLKEHIKTKLNDESLNVGVDVLIDLNDAKFIELKSTGGAKLWGVRSVDIQKEVINILNDVKIFDPACGSGAFPMGMLQLISQTYDRLVAKYDIDDKKHVYASSKSAYNKYESKLNIIKNNLFGSDIEPMAIEIARLRSWLSLMIEEENEVHPLPNLDFNFVCSNSLLKLEKNRNIFGIDFEDEFKKLRDEYFNTHSKNGKQDLKTKFINLYKQTSDSMNSKRIEQLSTWNPFSTASPSVFFDSKIMFDVGKFDILIANPPYIQLQKDKGKLAKLYKNQNYKTFETTGDIYVLFYELGIELLNSSGILTYITSNKWMKTRYGEKLRDYLANKTNPKSLIDLGNKAVFENATVDVNILITKKETNEFECKAVEVDKEITSFTNSKLKFFINSFEEGNIWSIYNKIELSIAEKIKLKSVNINEIDIEINRGILTGLNSAFIISEDKRNEILSNNPTASNIIVPLLKGKDLNKFYYDFKGLWLLNIHNGVKSVCPRIDVKDYPYVKKHLDMYIDSLVKRHDQGDSPYNLRNCKYLLNFNSELIAWQRITDENNFVKTSSGFYVLDSIAHMKVEKKFINYLLGYLNSSLIYFWMYKNVHRLGERGFLLSNQYVNRIPIISVKEEITTTINEKVIELYKNNVNTTRIISEIDNLIYKYYDLTEEEISYIFSITNVDS